MDALDDAEIEAIQQDAEASAEQAWGPGGSQRRPNPHPAGSRQAEIWNHAWRNAYARENR